MALYELKGLPEFFLCECYIYTGIYSNASCSLLLNCIQFVVKKVNYVGLTQAVPAIVVHLCTLFGTKYKRVSSHYFKVNVHPLTG